MASVAAPSDLSFSSYSPLHGVEMERFVAYFGQPSNLPGARWDRSSPPKMTYSTLAIDISKNQVNQSIGW